ncbi:MAG: DNA primase [Clostridia bacterium]|nr:DNA primase [Clostridia bacterium]
MRIPDNFIEEVINRNPLEEIVAQYTTLRRAGSNMVGCCPFHQEKTPSFTLYSSPPHYYCYGCGAGGDVITFVRQMENLDYVSAIEFLANRAGLSMPVSDVAGERINKKRFYEMNAEAARFWHAYLLSPKGKKGLDYLMSRGLGLPIIKRFGLGHADDDWHLLTNHLLKKGYGEKELTEAFLCSMGKNGKLYDRFRNRAIFPIIDAAGNVVAFSGRLIPPGTEKDQKYYNTTDTPVFKKSRNVFALNLAKKSPEKELILCEGNLDAVSLHAHGVSNAVASLGTALTPDQCRLLARYTERVCICYDADNAGKNATVKAIRLLTEAGLRVRVMTLTGTDGEGKPLKDPDDFIRNAGKSAFDKLWREAPGAIEYLFSLLLEKHELDTMDGKNAFVKDLVSLLSQVKDPIEQELFISRAAELTGLPSEVIRARTGKETVREARREQKEQLEREMRKSQGLGNTVNPDKAKFAASAAKEEAILGILLLRREYLFDSKIRPRLVPEIFNCEFCRKVMSLLLNLTEDEKELSLGFLNENLTPQEVGELEGMKKKREELGNNATSVLLELIRRLEDEKKKTELKNEPLSSAWMEKLKAEKAKKE